MDNETKEKLMDKYASGKLSLAEQQTLETILQTNPEFQKELDMRKDISDAIFIAGNRDLRKMLDKLHNQLVVNKNSTSKRKRVFTVIFLLVAVILVGLIASPFIFDFNRNSVKTTENLPYASYYKPNISSTRAVTDKSDVYLVPFVKAYSTENYSQAIILARPYLESSTNEVKLLTSIAALEEGDTPMAMSLLDSILSTSDYYYVDHAKWFKALGYLQLGNEPLAKEILTELVKDSDADHHTDAKILLNKM